MADRRAPSAPAGEADAASTKPRRPSFASPTKASLNRSNPDIVKRRGIQKSKDEENPLASDPNRPSSEHSAGSGGARTSQDSRVVTTAARGFMGKPGPNGKPINRPSPRPFPPRAQDDDDMVDPFQRRGLRRSPPTGVLPRIEREEPDLPPTPIQAGLSDPAAVISSPSGIHSSPSKRAKRHRALSDRTRSSPSKQAPLKAQEAREEPPSPTTAKESRQHEAEKPASKSRNTSRPHKARKIAEADPLASERGVRDALLDEITNLKRDLATLNRESERLYRSLETQTGKPSTEAIGNIEGLIDVLCRRVLPAEEQTPSIATEEWLEAAMNPIGLLPFGGAMPLYLPAPTSEKEEEQESQPISHYPITMNAVEELPYLQLFSSLAFHSAVNIVPRNAKHNANDGTIMQKHDISISSSPPGLFTAKVGLTVNTKKLSIAEINISKLEPAAARELGPFVRSVADNKNNGSSNHIRSSALTRNASVITWAMGEWVRLATKRARLWCAVEQTLSTKDGIAKSVATIRAGKKRKRRQRDSDDEDSDDDEAGNSKSRQCTKAQLLPHMGRTSYDLNIADPSADEDGDSAPSIRISWTIGFDWTGEGHSKMGLQVETPPSWYGQDSDAKLGKIPGAFDKLITDKVEPLDAIKTVVALLVGGGWK